MKASKQLIEMLTQGKRNYVEISQIFGVTGFSAALNP